MLIDWVSMVLDVSTAEDRALVARLSESRDVIVRLSPGGSIQSESFPRPSKRSDSHKLSYGLTRNRITIDGSPARLGQDNNVFGSMNLRDCGERMRRYMSAEQKVVLPPLSRWRFTRVDLTQNYDCGSLTHVKTALEALEKVAGGHLKASTFSDTVYWNRNSDLWKAKAYAKGPHLQYQLRNQKAGALPDEVVLAQQLLRLEVTLANKLLRDARLNWDNFTEEFAMQIFTEYARKLVPENCAEISSDQQLMDVLRTTYGKRKANQLCGMWMAIKSVGLEAARANVSRSTWFKYQADFKAVGLSLGDLAEGKILPFRPRQVIARPVDSWAQIQRAA